MANEGLGINLEQCGRMASGLDGPHALVFKQKLTLTAFFNLPWALHTLGRDAEACRLMTDIGITWAAADDRAKEHTPSEPQMRPFSEEPDAYYRFCSEDLAWSIKLQYVLCTSWREVPPADVIAALPSPDVLE